MAPADHRNHGQPPPYTSSPRHISTSGSPYYRMRPSSGSGKFLALYMLQYQMITWWQCMWGLVCSTAGCMATDSALSVQRTTQQFIWSTIFIRHGHRTFDTSPNWSGQDRHSALIEHWLCPLITLTASVHYLDASDPTTTHSVGFLFYYIWHLTRSRLIVEMFGVMATNLSSLTWTHLTTVGQKSKYGCHFSLLLTEHTTQQLHQKTIVKWLLLTSLECIPIHHDFLESSNLLGYFSEFDTGGQ
jgi:hypothetical protein